MAGCYWLRWYWVKGVSGRGESKRGDSLLGGSLAYEKLQENQGHQDRARKVGGWCHESGQEVGPDHPRPEATAEI